MDVVQDVAAVVVGENLPGDKRERLQHLDEALPRINVKVGDSSLGEIVGVKVNTREPKASVGAAMEVGDVVDDARQEVVAGVADGCDH